jgi:hypothetical protein
LRGVVGCGELAGGCKIVGRSGVEEYGGGDLVDEELVVDGKCGRG